MSTTLPPGLPDRRRAGPLVALALLLAGLTALPSAARAAAGPAAPGADMPTLRAVLAGLPPGCPLRVFPSAGHILAGRLVDVRDDTLWLRPEEGARGAEPAAWPVPAADIVRLERRGAADETGAGIGAAVLGLLGGLTGAALAGIGAGFDGNDDDDGVILGGAMMGVAGGAAVGALLGAGLGSLGRHWEVVYPPGRPAARRTAAPDTTRGAPSRLVVEAGWARGQGNGQDDSGATLALGLLTRRSPRFEYGPVVRGYAVDGMPEVPGPRHEPTGVQPGGSFLLEGRLQSAAAGWRPWLDVGAGILLTDDIHLGGQLGVGLRRRDAHGLEWGVAARRAIIGGNSAAFDAIWSLTGSVAFRP